MSFSLQSVPLLLFPRLRVGLLAWFSFTVMFFGMPSFLRGDELADSSYNSYSSIEFDVFDEDAALTLLDYYNEGVQEFYGAYNKAEFTYKTNLTAYNQHAISLVAAPLGELVGDVTFRAERFNTTDFAPSTKRRFDALLYYSQTSSSDDSMTRRFVDARLCKSPDVCLSLEPDLTRIMAESRDYDELYWAWDGWRSVSGAPSKEDFNHFVEQRNMMAVWYYGREDEGDFQRSKYEVDDLDAQVVKLYSELEPLYKQLHAYARRKLYQFYGPDYINPKGPLPAHLLGDMWGQIWSNIFNIVDPYPTNSTRRLTSVLREKNLRTIDFYRIAEEFFTSLGLLKAPHSFWNESMFEKPTDGRDVVCHASAWDFKNQRDFRVSMCGDITSVHFLVAHHEMGHIQYYMQYADQPVEFRDGANPAFQEAVGDSLALSVSTPEHKAAIGLLPSPGNDSESDIRFLLETALINVAYLPFGILVDLWRWEIYANKTKPEDYNKRWWELRLKYQGVISPTQRTDEHFDPPSKWHITTGTPYVRYFLSNIIQFQFHKALCNASGHVGPLFKCDIYRSKEAGKLLSDMLKLGSSEHWSVAMKTITGQTEMSSAPFLEYFQPLLEWLEKENENETIGWDEMADWQPKPPKLLYSYSTSACTRTSSVISAIIGIICALWCTPGLLV